MTITSTPSEVSYAGDGLTTVFPIPFVFDTAADLRVLSTDTSGNISPLTTGFSVSGGNGATGSLTFVVPPALTVSITILDNPVVRQSTDYVSNDPFPAESHERALDKLTRICKRLSNQISRSIRLPDGDPILDMSLGSVTNRRGKYLFFNAVTGALEYATAIVGSALSQSIIGLFLNPQTEAEAAAGVIPTNHWWPEGWVDRYGTNTAPGLTNMTTAIQTAVNVAHAKGAGGTVHFRPGMQYRTLASILYPASSQRIHLYGNGAYLKVDHLGDGIVWLATNENYSGHSISDLTITGPNPLSFGSTWTSTGSGINMNRDTTTNVVTSYNSRLRNVTIQGFKYGMNLQAVIGLSVTDCYILFNEEGVRFDGGQTNGNCFTNCHIRYNRKRGICSTGRSGGSLTTVTNNKFFGCLIESNVPDTTVGGGTVPTDSTGIYLNNCYDFVFVGCYSENHAAGIYLTGGSKGHKFLAHRIASGNSRLDTIYLSGAGVYNNEFDIHADSLTLTEVNVRSDHADQQFNSFRGNGINFVESGEILGKLDYSDIKPSMAFATTRGYGLIRMPSQGYASNVGVGTNPGEATGIGTGAALLNARGLGEIVFGSGITGGTTFTTVSGLRPHSFLVLRGGQNSFQCILSAAAFGLYGGKNVDLRTGMEVVLWVGGDGTPREVGRNFGTSALYTVVNASADRSLNVTADTTAQVAAVLGTLIADLQAQGLLS